MTRRLLALVLGLVAGAVMLPAFIESGVPLRWWGAAVRYALGVPGKRPRH